MKIGLYWILGGMTAGLIALPGVTQPRSVFTESQLDNYAGAVFAIEQKRDDTLRRAKQLPDWEMIARRADSKKLNVCDLRREEQSLSMQPLCDELFRFAKDTIERHGFKDSREFNQITLSHQKNRELQKRIQEKVADLTRRTTLQYRK